MLQHCFDAAYLKIESGHVKIVSFFFPPISLNGLVKLELTQTVMSNVSSVWLLLVVDISKEGIMKA